MTNRWFVTGMFAIVMSASIPPSPLATAGQGLPPTSPQSRNLEGVWTFSTLTPLERSAEFADKPFLTDAEAAA